VRKPLDDTTSAVVEDRERLAAIRGRGSGWYRSIPWSAFGGAFLRDSARHERLLGGLMTD